MTSIVHDFQACVYPQWLLCVCVGQNRWWFLLRFCSWWFLCPKKLTINWKSAWQTSYQTRRKHQKLLLDQWKHFVGPVEACWNRSIYQYFTKLNDPLLNSTIFCRACCFSFIVISQEWCHCHRILCEWHIGTWVERWPSSLAELEVLKGNLDI